MRYFEIKEPYYALIKAEHGDDAVNKYISEVAGDDEEFDNIILSCDLVPEDYAIAKFSRAYGEDKTLIPFKEIMNMIRSDKEEVLLIDGTLI